MTSLPPPPAHASERSRALAGLLVATVLWGVSFPLIKALVFLHAELLPGSGNWFVTAMTVMPRYVLATALLGGWLLLRGQLQGIRRLEWAQGVQIGLFAAGGVIFQNDGLQFTDASTSAFLTQLYAILIPVYVAARTRTQPGWGVWGSCALVTLGVALLGRFDWTTLRFGRGEAETLLSSVFFMGQILGLGEPRYAQNRALPVTLVMFAVQALVFVVMTLMSAPSLAAIAVPLHSLPWVGFTVALTLASTLGAFLLMNHWQPKITATEAGLIYCAEPIFGTLLAWFLPAWLSIWGGISYANEVATWNLWIGGGLITVANVLIQLRPPKRAAS